MTLSTYRIEYFSKGQMKINGEVYNSDLIVCPDKIYHNWRRSNPNSLKINDFQSIISERPAYIVIGNGQENNLQLDNYTKNRLEDLGFDVYVAKTRAAVNKYNKICKSRKTIGMFHLD